MDKNRSVKNLNTTKTTDSKSYGKKSKFVFPTFVMGFILSCYIALSLFMYITKNNIAVYEVNSGVVSNAEKVKGKIFRNETVYKAGENGYLNCLVYENTRISKNTLMYLITNDNNIVSKNISLTNDNYKDIKKKIAQSYADLSDYNYQSIYNFKLNLNNYINELVRDNTFSEIKSGTTISALDAAYSGTAGVVSYQIDGHESDLISGFAPKDVNVSNYFEIAQNGKFVSKGDNLLKVVSNDKWFVVFEGKNNRYDSYLDKRIKINFPSKGFITYAKLLKISGLNNKEYYCLEFDEYIEQFLDRRVLDFEMVFKEVNGLKIPSKAIVEKECFAIPKEYLIVDDDGNGSFYKLEMGNPVSIDVDVAKEDDSYYYVTSNEKLNIGDILYKSTTERMELKSFTKIYGAYNVNKGYAVFRNIEVLNTNNDYAIIKKGTSFGLSDYDRIVYDAKKVREGEFISW